jgi:hypothetical protein
VAGKGQGAFVLLLSQNQLLGWWPVGWQNRVWFVSCSKGTHVQHGRQELMSNSQSDIVCGFVVSKTNNRARVLTEGITRVVLVLRASLADTHG